MVEDDRVIFGPFEPGTVDKLTVRCRRPAVSSRSFLYPAKERVAVYPARDVPWEPEVGPEKPPVLVGARGCELRALSLLDWVFLEGDFVDPFYKARREALLVVASDCVAFAPSCFCTLLGEKPYPTGGYDLNLSPIEGGYVVEAGSPRGEKAASEYLGSAPEATAEQLEERDRIRMSELVAQVIEAKGWNPTMAKCVECGACTNICPTCYCFYLYDQQSELSDETKERVRFWDSCLFADYARMAGVGGVKANPRAAFVSRYRNRFLHKYAWQYQQVGRLGCVGCGRCFDACAGGIDLREVLRDLAK
jgi:formate hydrogenlyase subunit 6/NADH:ubiquinone oxidoreductase subunit I